MGEAEEQGDGAGCRDAMESEPAPILNPAWAIGSGLRPGCNCSLQGKRMYLGWVIKGFKHCQKAE